MKIPKSMIEEFKVDCQRFYQTPRFCWNIPGRIKIFEFLFKEYGEDVVRKSNLWNFLQKIELEIGSPEFRPDLLQVERKKVEEQKEEQKASIIQRLNKV